MNRCDTFRGTVAVLAAPRGSTRSLMAGDQGLAERATSPCTDAGRACRSAGGPPSEITRSWIKSWVEVPHRNGPQRRVLAGS